MPISYFLVPYLGKRLDSQHQLKSSKKSSVFDNRKFDSKALFASKLELDFTD